MAVQMGTLILVGYLIMIIYVALALAAFGAMVYLHGFDWVTIVASMGLLSGLAGGFLTINRMKET